MILRTILLLLALTSLNVNAIIISGNQVTDSGRNVDLSGLEWLSFDDASLGTMDRTYAEIANASSAWSIAGWRHATVGEVNSLWDSLGLTAGSHASNEDGVNFLIDNWGAVYNPPAVFYPGDLTQTFTEYWIVEAMFGDGASGEADSLFLRTDFSIVNERNGQEVSRSDFFDTASFAQYIPLDELFSSGVASFLVRDSGQPDDEPVVVSEPAPLALLGLGLACLLSGRRHPV